ncbi:MerR family transcriptional regulator [Brachybacterium sp. GCM10030252]|uniref:MerR family transcriptional regulator n=1 Tax=Brachybacterium sp. GCM10030252 TaxID=3273380 RepID=UPI00361734AF
MRPIDLAREHGLSSQAVRNYEQAGALPPAERTASGHRVYTARHAAALRAFLTLVQASGHRPALEIMTALHADDVERALALLDGAHAQLLRDRSTLDAVAQAAGALTGEGDTAEAVGSTSAPGAGTRGTGTGDTRAGGVARLRDAPGRDLRIGELAARLEISPATLRAWEDQGLIAPPRERGSGQRLYPPAQVRDAELVHLLRRAGHRLEDIALVLDQVRSMGETSSVRTALEASRRQVTARGLALLEASAALAAYVRPEATSLRR